MSKYVIRHADGRVEGPMSSADLRERAAAGRIGPTDEIAAAGTGNWVPAARVAGVREHLVEGGQPGRPSAATVATAASTPEDAPRSRPRAIDDPLEEVSIPRYGILRYVADSIASIGWLLVTVVFIAAIFITIVGAFTSTPWIALLLAAPPGIALRFAMQYFAARSSKAGWLIAVVALPLIPGLALAAHRAEGEPEKILLHLIPTLSIIGALFGSAMAGLLFVAIGEFLNAHADIASNSWRRARAG